MRQMRPFFLSAAATIFVLARAANSLAKAQTFTPAQPLKVSISTENTAITEPFPLRLILDFHNSSQNTLWLYAPLRGPASAPESNMGEARDGSTLLAHIEAAGAADSRTPAVGTLLRPARMPRPRLVRVTPGGDYQMRVAIHIAPATQAPPPAGPEPVLGVYTVSIAYGAFYSNGAAIDRDLGVHVWQGSLESNRLSIKLQLAPPANAGSISGTVLGRQMQPDWGILVSLSDWNERLIAQAITGNDGAFNFSHLPDGRYWVTVRQPGADYETSFFEHADISSSQPDANLKLIMLNDEEYEANQMRHKPVLFRIVDSAGRPLEGAVLDILWSSGTVMETVKAATGLDGMAETSLLPGSNYVTIQKHHCLKEDRTANVAGGAGIAGFSFSYECGK